MNKFLAKFCGIVLGFVGAAAYAGGLKQDVAYAVVLPQQKGAVATVQPLATQAAVDAFNRGGNAIDAALAAAFTLGVVDSHNSGIGGGCFILVRLANGKIIAIDGREMAPAKAYRDMYLLPQSPEERAKGAAALVDRSLSKTGALAVGIPGSVQALYDLQSMGGKLSFSDVLLPAAALAEAGFPIDNTLAKRLSSKAEDIAKFPATAAVFLTPEGKPKATGDTLKQADLAATYRLLAKHGPQWFYRGDFAKLLRRRTLRLTKRFIASPYTASLWGLMFMVSGRQALAVPMLRKCLIF